jgi:inhibitor of the pro-sigma K processing machinery
MKTVWGFLLAVSSVLLLLLLLRRRAAREWLPRFGFHLVLAAVAIYVLNFSSLVPGWHLPLNPLTIGIVALLGIPGIALVFGLQVLLAA